MTSESRPGGTYGYTYNAAGRMNAFSINGMLQATYTYDAMGRQAIRTLTSPSPVTIHSVFASQGRRIAEYDEATGGLLREYVWNGWEPVAVVEGEVVYYVRADHIGRPVFATNASGVKVWTATYRPFGEVVTSTGSTLTSARFPGQWFQSESGLHQNWMRDYDPTTGRYLEADPLGLVDGASVYGYVKGNPGRWVDPRGEELLYLTSGGWIISKDWTYDPSLPAKIGSRFRHNCSDAVLEFHRVSPTNPDAHWHYHPYGQFTTGRKAGESRWKDITGNDHLFPTYVLEIEDCPCSGNTIPNPEPAWGSVLMLMLLLPLAFGVPA